MAKLFKKFQNNNDTGFGASASNQARQYIKKDGSYNVTRTGVDFFEQFNPYHDLIAFSWTKFNLLVLATYLVMNLIFTIIYYAIGVEHLGGMIAVSPFEKFMEAFFFSCQTFSTVGYGRVNPQGYLTSAIASLESLIGLMSFALATGLIYGRFARPNIKLLSSKNAIIAPYKDEKALMFRIVNSRKNPLIELEVTLMASFFTPDNPMVQFVPLKLERNAITSLALSWTIVHPIDEESPLYNLAQTDFEEIDLQLLFFIKAFDESYSQTVHTRLGYTNKDIVWNKKFVPMYKRSNDGSTTLLELELLSETVDVG
ncbi:MAG: ion channel [Bacteroidia bacterium]